jgi:hypothetical protein
MKGKEVFQATNLEREVKKKPPLMWNDILYEELLAYIGILIAAGANKASKMSVHQMWCSDPAFATPFYTAAMSRSKFCLISTFLRYDDFQSRKDRLQESKDKLEAIKDVVEQFTEKCHKNYSVHEHITIDDRLAVFRGHCPFRVYMKSKPGRYGIKIWVASDVETSYIRNLQIYTGMQDGKKETNQGHRVVLDLSKHLQNSGRGITVDNFFTSIPLAQDLLKKKLTLIGTVRANKVEIPPEFLLKKTREEHSSLFGFTKNMTMSSYVPKKGKSVILLSTQHLDNCASPEHPEKKPEPIG